MLTIIIIALCCSLLAIRKLRRRVRHLRSVIKGKDEFTHKLGKEYRRYYNLYHTCYDKPFPPHSIPAQMQMEIYCLQKNEHSLQLILQRERSERKGGA